MPGSELLNTGEISMRVATEVPCVLQRDALAKKLEHSVGADALRIPPAEGPQSGGPHYLLSLTP